MNNNRPPSSNFQKSERETGNQVSLALVVNVPLVKVKLKSLDIQL